MLTAGLADAVLLFVFGTAGGISCLSSAPLEWRWSWWPPGWACRDMFTGAGAPGPVSWVLLLVAVLVVTGFAIVALTGRIFVSASTEASSVRSLRLAPACAEATRS